MKHIRQNPYIERGWIRFVGTRGFFFCFATVTCAAIVAGFLQRGPAILAFPLLAWSPFLLLIGLHAASHAINESRDSGASISPVATRVQCAAFVSLDLFVIAACASMFFRFDYDEPALNPFFCSPFLIFIILDLASHVLSFARSPWSSILRRVIPPVGWIFMAVYLAVGALWTLSIGVHS